MKEFLEIQRGTDKAEGTIKLYERGLEQFTDWMEDQDLNIREVDHRDIRRYLSYLKTEEEFAPKTIRSRFTAVSQFYEDITANGTEFDDPTEPVRIAEYAPQTSRREEVTRQKHIWLERDELQELVENVPPPKIRNKLVVLFQYYTGLRRQEVVDVRLQDLDRHNRRVQVRGKGDKINTAYWNPKLDRLLSTWLDSGFRDASPYARESPYLFVTDSSPQLSPSRVSYIVKQAAENAGLQEVLYEDANGDARHKITSHTLRHSYAMHFLEDEEATIGELSKLLAHESVTTTEKYGEMQDKRLEQAYRRSGPDIDFDHINPE